MFKCPQCNRDVYESGIVLFHGFVNSITQEPTFDYSQAIDLFGNNLKVPKKVFSVELDARADSTEKIYVFHKDCFESISGGLFC
jgi:hypothetical protein